MEGDEPRRIVSARSPKIGQHHCRNQLQAKPNPAILVAVGTRDDRSSCGYLRQDSPMHQSLPLSRVDRTRPGAILYEEEPRSSSTRALQYQKRPDRPSAAIQTPSGPIWGYYFNLMFQQFLAITRNTFSRASQPIMLVVLVAATVLIVLSNRCRPSPWTRISACSWTSGWPPSSSPGPYWRPSSPPMSSVERSRTRRR